MVICIIGITIYIKYFMFVPDKNGMINTDGDNIEFGGYKAIENVWLTQNSMAELFDTTRNNITMHIKNIFEEGELHENSVCKDILKKY